MSRLPALRLRQVLVALKKAGFREARQTGSHAVLKHPDGREVVLPIHNKDLKRATMLGIIKRTGFTQDEFRHLL